MKKILAAAAAVMMLASMLTACNNDTSSDNSSSSSSSTSSSSSSSSSDNSSTESSSSSSAETSSGESSSSSAESSSAESSQAPESSSTHESTPSGSGRPTIDITDNTGYEYPDTRAGDIMMEILNTGDWAPMEVMGGDAVDPESLGWIFPNLDVAPFDDFCLATTIMSANLYKVVVAHPASGQEDAAKASVDAYYNYIKTDPNALAYPSFEESVAGTVRNSTSDGYFYVIVNPDGETIQNSVK